MSKPGFLQGLVLVILEVLLIHIDAEKMALGGNQIVRDEGIHGPL